jgi:hypothetical protein
MQGRGGASRFPAAEMFAPVPGTGSSNPLCGVQERIHRLCRPQVQRSLPKHLLRHHRPHAHTRRGCRPAIAGRCRGDLPSTGTGRAAWTRSASGWPMAARPRKMLIPVRRDRGAAWTSALPFRQRWSGEHQWPGSGCRLLGWPPCAPRWRHSVASSWPARPWAAGHISRVPPSAVKNGRGPGRQGGGAFPPHWASP